MIDVSHFLWKLEMLKIWIAVEVDFCTVFHDTMKIFDETGVLVKLNANYHDSFEDFLQFAEYQYRTTEHLDKYIDNI